MTKPKASSTSKLADLLLIYRNNPILFFKQQLGVDPDEQQQELINAAVEPGCRIVVKSGRGCGKTTTIVGLGFYFLLFFDDVNIRVLSPTEAQLKGVFMREVKKLSINMMPEIRDYFDIKALGITNKYKELNTLVCATAGTDKTENVSGVHSKKQIFLMDEASGIADEIYHTILGSLGTAIEDHVICASNPNRGAGEFYSDLFLKKPEPWQLFTFTAIRCAFVKDSFVEQMKALYGEDGDEYRVSVLGEFPRADGSTFIPGAIVEESVSRANRYQDYVNSKIVAGVDVARSLSGDKSVICVRQGCRIIDLVSFQTADTMEVVARVRDTCRQYKVSAVYMDATGVGGPVGDRIRELITDIPIIDVMVANRSSDPVQYANLRTQLWGELRQWLMIGDIPDHHDLKKELMGMTWGYNGRMAMQLTSKKQLRGRVSPDHADALALTMMDIQQTIRRRNVLPRKVKQSRYLWV